MIDDRGSGRFRGRRSGGRRGGRSSIPQAGAVRYPRTARINKVLGQVVAEELERLSDFDERLGLLTVTGVHVDPDLRHATIWLGSISEAAAEALVEDRVRLQAAIARQVRLKRTPLLAFQVDPALSAGQRVDEILRGLGTVGGDGDAGR